MIRKSCPCLPLFHELLCIFSRKNSVVVPSWTSIWNHWQESTTTAGFIKFIFRFARIDVEGAPFLADRLKIQMLPCVIIFKDGIAIDRIVGFDELGGDDTFTTAALEKRLKHSTVFDVQIRNIYFDSKQK